MKKQPVASFIKQCYLPSHCDPASCVFNRYFVVQSLSYGHLFVTPWTAAHQAPLSTIFSQGLLKFMAIEFGDAI